MTIIRSATRLLAWSILSTTPVLVLALIGIKGAWVIIPVFVAICLLYLLQSINGKMGLLLVPSVFSLLAYALVVLKRTDTLGAVIASAIVAIAIAALITFGFGTSLTRLNESGNPNPEADVDA